MPIYEYRCKSCQSKFEALRSFKDSDSPIKCSNCQSTETHRVQSSCYSTGNSKSQSSSTSGCSGCSGGACSSCSH